MSSGHDDLLEDLGQIVFEGLDRTRSLQAVADRLKSYGNYRWVGLYDVNRTVGNVTNVVWTGSGAPEHPTFPIEKGLTGAVISQRKTINVDEVASDPRYLTAFGSTRSEIIVPVRDQTGEIVGTIDVESENANAFGLDVQALLEECAAVIRPLWKQ